MEIERQKIRALSPLEQPRTAQEFKAKQARAAQLLRGDLEGDELQRYVEERVVTTRLEDVLNWARANAMFPMTFGLACCAIEMMSMVSARYDIARFGAEAFRASPRQADLMILSGRVSIKMAPVVRRIYDQMLEPKWAISMGACSSSGGMFANYAIVQGADKFMPIDMHVPGCPPRPEALLYGFNKLQRKILGSPDQGWRQRYNAAGSEEWARGGSASLPSPEAAAAYEAARELVIAGEGETEFQLPAQTGRAVASTGPTLPAGAPGHGPGEEAQRDA